MMRLVRSAAQMQQIAVRLRRAGKSIGFVPTMGALHEGHVSLVRAARRAHDVVIASLFVNPLQFGPREDFRRYPRAFASDRRLLAKAGCDWLFAPDVEQIYPRGFATHVDVGPLGLLLEGAIRPGHFRGVATVVCKLFQIVQPTAAYFGQKDYQQCAVIRRMIADLALPVRFRMMPIVREPDGLAMSSRNVYLTAAQRAQAVVLSRALRFARARIRRGERSAAAIRALVRRDTATATLGRLDYVELVDVDTLQPLRRVKGRAAILLAVRFGATRLIDNVLVEVP